MLSSNWEVRNQTRYSFISFLIFQYQTWLGSMRWIWRLAIWPLWSSWNSCRRRHRLLLNSPDRSSFGKISHYFGHCPNFICFVHIKNHIKGPVKTSVRPSQTFLVITLQDTFVIQQRNFMIISKQIFSCVRACAFGYPCFSTICWLGMTAASKTDVWNISENSSVLVAWVFR